MKKYLTTEKNNNQTDKKFFETTTDDPGAPTAKPSEIDKIVNETEARRETTPPEDDNIHVAANNNEAGWKTEENLEELTSTNRTVETGATTLTRVNGKASTESTETRTPLSNAAKAVKLVKTTIEPQLETNNPADSTKVQQHRENENKQEQVGEDKGLVKEKDDAAVQNANKQKRMTKAFGCPEAKHANEAECTEALKAAETMYRELGKQLMELQRIFLENKAATTMAEVSGPRDTSKYRLAKGM